MKKTPHVHMLEHKIILNLISSPGFTYYLCDIWV